MIKNKDRYIIHVSDTLMDGLKKLNSLSGGIMTLFAINDAGEVCGTVTDGDIRRALMNGISLDDPIQKIMYAKFRSIKGNDINVQDIKKYREARIRLLPWLNDDGTLRDLVDISDGKSVLPLSAIVMAGGKGERLRPLTLNTPKPLLKIGGKAIIDYNIESLIRSGITNITVTTRYLSEQIKDHFSKEIGGIRVKCVTEDTPLGTIGSAALADIPKHGKTIVMNSDLLTTISFEDMYLHHLATSADITIAVIPYQVSVPYAILNTDPNDPERVTGLSEKPSYSFFANAGIYIFPNSLLNNLSTENKTDATDLIEQAINNGYKVTQFPINGTWIDIGSPTDFKQATELIKYVQRSQGIELNS